MNLTNIFNFKYIKENFKKSKSTLILILLLFPVLTSSYIMLNKNEVVTLTTMSVIAHLGMFLPIMLSYMCFGYIYKKKSIDFINSMPLSRKSIYFSNTLLGIIFIVVLFIITIILSLITSNFVNSFLPFNVILDYFILWTTVYVFIFLVSNLAMSLSGNEITTIIVSILLVLFIPFMYDFTTNLKLDNVRTYIELDPQMVNKMNLDNSNSIDNKNRYVFSNKIENANTTNFIYRKFKEIFEYNNLSNLYDKKEIHLMTILSIIYLILGYLIFKKKKMENSETSFKSYGMHTLIKCMTLTPFMTLFMYIIKKEEFSIAVVVFFVLILGYYYAYDLITKKGIQNFKKSILYFLLFTLVMYVYIDKMLSSADTTKILTLDSIESVEIQGTNFRISEVKDKDIIAFTLVNKLSDIYDFNAATIKYKVGNKYYISRFNSDNCLKEVTKMLYEKNLQNKILDTSPNKSIAIKIDDDLYPTKDIKNIDKYLNSTNKTINVNSLNINFYYYDKLNHKIIVDDSYINDELLNYLYNIHNQNNLTKLKKIKEFNSNMSISVEKKVLNDYYWQENNDIDKFIFEYLINLPKEKIDLAKPYIIFKLYDENKIYNIVSNDLEGFTKYLKEHDIDNIFTEPVNTVEGINDKY